MARSKAGQIPESAPSPTGRGEGMCALHHVALEETGWCPMAQAWWRPKFACPNCHGWLWDNGYCQNCTPRTRVFPGDYFEQRWDEDAGREYGHFVRVYRGPTPAPDPEPFLAELRALRVGAHEEPTIRLRGCGCDKCVAYFTKAAPDEPAWITSDA